MHPIHIIEKYQNHTLLIERPGDGGLSMRTAYGTPADAVAALRSKGVTRAALGTVDTQRWFRKEDHPMLGIRMVDFGCAIEILPASGKAPEAPAAEHPDSITVSITRAEYRTLLDLTMVNDDPKVLANGTEGLVERIARQLDYDNWIDAYHRFEPGAARMVERRETLSAAAGRVVGPEPGPEPAGANGPPAPKRGKITRYCGAELLKMTSGGDAYVGKPAWIVDMMRRSGTPVAELDDDIAPIGPAFYGMDGVLVSIPDRTVTVLDKVNELANDPARGTKDCKGCGYGNSINLTPGVHKMNCLSLDEPAPELDEPKPVPGSPMLLRFTGHTWCLYDTLDGGLIAETGTVLNTLAHRPTGRQVCAPRNSLNPFALEEIEEAGLALIDGPAPDLVEVVRADRAAPQPTQTNQRLSDLAKPRGVTMPFGPGMNRPSASQIRAEQKLLDEQAREIQMDLLSTPRPSHAYRPGPVEESLLREREATKAPSLEEVRARTAWQGIAPCATVDTMSEINRIAALAHAMPQGLPRERLYASIERVLQSRLNQLQDHMDPSPF